MLMKKIVPFLFIITFIAYCNVNAQIASESFDDITTLPGLGWVETNVSNPIGTLGYFQGNTTVFGPYTTAGYLAVNYNSTAGTGTISNWMISPIMTLNNTDVVTFWTRTAAASTWPDRLQVRLNPLGTTAIANENSVGDFTILLVEVNPDLTAGGYPEEWTQFTGIVSGLTGPTACRVGFRYFVTDGGPTGNNSNYVGIDEFLVQENNSVPEINLNSFSTYPNPAEEFINIRTGSSLSGNYSVQIVNALGQIVKTELINMSPFSDVRIDLGIPSGTYAIRIIDDQNNIAGIKSFVVR